MRSLFDIPSDVAYFNCASITPLLRESRDAIAASVERHVKPWQLQSDVWVNDAEARRQLFARLVGLDCEGVALVPATSYGLAIAAANLSAWRGARVVMPAKEFPSDVYAWRRFCERAGAEIVVAARPAEATWTEVILDMIDRRVAVVAVPYVHWMDGALFDLVAIADRAREVGAKIVIDASQSLGVLSHDFARVRPDFVVAVGYKWLLGPFGLAYLYMAPEYRDGRPLEENWITREGAEDFARLTEYQGRYRAGARRFDAGQSAALELNDAACVGLRQLQAWSVESVSERLCSMTEEIETGARSRGLAVSSGPWRGPHMLSIKLGRVSASHASSIFAAKQIHVGIRGDVVRISPHMHVSRADIERLLDALGEIV